MLRAFGRLILVPIALLLATTAAAFVLVTLGQERVVRAMAANPASVDSIFGFGELLLRLAVALFSVTTLLPVLLMIVAGEVARIRTPIYYVLGGGLTLAVVPFLARLSPVLSGPAASGQVGIGDAATVLWQLFATAGFAAGFVYWLVAGRSA